MIEPNDDYRFWTGTSPKRAFDAQKTLLAGLSHITEFVNIGANYINTIIINHEKPTTKNLVMTHGYGAALGFYYKNYQKLSELENYKIYSVDWLGMGVSSRPAFVKSHKNETDDEITANAESFFVESLEAWRKQKGLDKMVLLGHSLGGYLSTCYSLKYPERVEKLILVSPVGIPEAPAEDKANPRPTSNLLKLARAMWSRNITPMSVIRTMGSFGGTRLVTGYSSRRFAHLEPDELTKFDNYIYHICAQPGSGEFALARLLLPGAFARKPLAPRLQKLIMPTTFIYGDNDWMDHRHAVKVAPSMAAPTKVATIRNSGHHLYLDNPIGFNEAVIAELQDSNATHPDVGYRYHFLKSKQ